MGVAASRGYGNVDAGYLGAGGNLEEIMEVCMSCVDAEFVACVEIRKSTRSTMSVKFTGTRPLAADFNSNNLEVRHVEGLGESLVTKIPISEKSVICVYNDQ